MFSGKFSDGTPVAPASADGPGHARAVSAKFEVHLVTALESSPLPAPPSLAWPLSIPRPEIAPEEEGLDYFSDGSGDSTPDAAGAPDNLKEDPDFKLDSDSDLGSSSGSDSDSDSDSCFYSGSDAEPGAGAGAREGFTVYLDPNGGARALKSPYPGMNLWDVLAPFLQTLGLDLRPRKQDRPLPLQVVFCSEHKGPSFYRIEYRGMVMYFRYILPGNSWVLLDTKGRQLVGKSEKRYHWPTAHGQTLKSVEGQKKRPKSTKRASRPPAARPSPVRRPDWKFDDTVGAMYGDSPVASPVATEPDSPVPTRKARRRLSPAEKLEAAQQTVREAQELVQWHEKAVKDARLAIPKKMTSIDGLVVARRRRGGGNLSLAALKKRRDNMLAKNQRQRRGPLSIWEQRKAELEEAQNQLEEAEKQLQETKKEARAKSKKASAKAKKTSAPISVPVPAPSTADALVAQIATLEAELAASAGARADDHRRLAQMKRRLAQMEDNARAVLRDEVTAWGADDSDDDDDDDDDAGDNRLPPGYSIDDILNPQPPATPAPATAPRVVPVHHPTSPWVLGTAPAVLAPAMATATLTVTLSPTAPSPVPAPPQPVAPKMTTAQKIRHLQRRIPELMEERTARVQELNQTTEQVRSLRLATASADKEKRLDLEMKAIHLRREIHRLEEKRDQMKATLQQLVRAHPRVLKRQRH